MAIFTASSLNSLVNTLRGTFSISDTSVGSVPQLWCPLNPSYPKSSSLSRESQAFGKVSLISRSRATF
jgi:hypothetical protein